MPWRSPCTKRPSRCSNSFWAASTTFLDKADAHAAAKKWDAGVVLNLRLYPDMFTLARQVRQACEHALAPGRIAGVELPKNPDSTTASRR